MIPDLRNNIPKYRQPFKEADRIEEHTISNTTKKTEEFSTKQ
jgi:hypothetical protein